MKKKLNLYLILMIIPFMILAVSASAKDDKVVVDKDGVAISTGDGTVVKTDEKGVDIKAGAAAGGPDSGKGAIVKTDDEGVKVKTGVAPGGSAK